MEKMETAHQPDQVASLSEIAQKIFDKLKTIGAKTPDQAASEPTNDEGADVLDGNGEELANNPLHSTESFADLPEGWKDYQNAMERENENRVEL
jgi:hypothetical protein